MTEKEFTNAFDNFDLDGQYAEFIMKNGAADYPICNGHTLLRAAEDGYLFEEFKESMIK